MGQTVMLAAILIVLLVFYLSGDFFTPSDPFCDLGAMGVVFAFLAVSCHSIGTKEGWIRMCDAAAGKVPVTVPVKAFVVTNRW